MAKFKVLVTQWVEEYATVEVEADSPEDAAELVESGEIDDIDWNDGEDSKDIRVSLVNDMEDRQIWKPEG